LLQRDGAPIQLNNPLFGCKGTWQAAAP